MNKRMTTMIIILLIVFGGLIGFNLIKKGLIKYYFAHFQPPAVTVSAVAVKEEDWRSFFSSVGNFVAEEGVDVNTQAAGKVSAIHFDSGQYVEKDTPLIDIDDTVEQATLKYNQADLTLQKTNFQRQTDLLKRNATAVSSVDDARARMLEAEASVQSTTASINLKHIKAPFSGVLGIRQINLGQYVQPGQTNIVSLQALDPIFLYFFIPEQYIALIKVGQKIEFVVEQNKDAIFEGMITAVNSKIDENTHNIQVEAQTSNCPAMPTKEFLHSPLLKKVTRQPSGKYLVQCDSDMNYTNKITQYNFIPGMFASINIEQPLQRKVMVLPTTAISYTMYGDSVFTIEKQKDEKNEELLTVKRVFVTTGQTRGNYSVIEKGLKPNQLVVAAGDLKLQNGTRVVIDTNNVLIDHHIDLLGQ